MLTKIYYCGYKSIPPHKATLPPPLLNWRSTELASRECLKPGDSINKISDGTQFRFYMYIYNMPSENI
jgi:hypothetical protein